MELTKTASFNDGGSVSTLSSDWSISVNRQGSHYQLSLSAMVRLCYYRYETLPFVKKSE
jgi:hypothetical protein